MAPSGQPGLASVLGRVLNTCAPGSGKNAVAVFKALVVLFGV